MSFHATAVLPTDPDFYMPTIEQWTALAEALHNESDECAASYVVPFAECMWRELDIGSAVRILVDLHKAGWTLAHDPAGTAEMGL